MSAKKLHSDPPPPPGRKGRTCPSNIKADLHIPLTRERIKALAAKQLDAPPLFQQLGQPFPEIDCRLSIKLIKNEGNSTAAFFKLRITLQGACVVPLLHACEGVPLSFRSTFRSLSSLPLSLLVLRCFLSFCMHKEITQ